MDKKIINTVLLYIKEKLSLLKIENNMKYKDFDKEDKKYVITSIFIDVLLVFLVLLIVLIFLI